MKPTKNIFITGLTLAALTAGAWAQSTPAPKKHKAKAAVVTTPTEPPATAADIQGLKDALAAQQQQIQQLIQQLQQSQQTSQQAQTAAADATTKADAAQVQARQQQQTVGELKTDVTDLKTNAATTTTTLLETQKNRQCAREPEFSPL